MKKRQLETAGGNTIKAPAKQEYQQRKACFTLNNYTQEDWEIFERQKRQFFRLVVGCEIAPTTGTPHLQGYCEFKKKGKQNKGERPIAFFKKLLGHNRTNFLKDRVKGNVWQNSNYCKKEGRRLISYNIPRELQIYTRDDLQEKHTLIVDKFIEFEDAKFGRKIHWFWEPKGGWGKSLCCSYMVDQMGATVISGKRTDMFCGLVKLIEQTGECPPIILVDIPRSSHGYIDYSGLEAIKNGMFFSPKYESGMVRFNRPWIICWGNEEPLYDLMSLDRWEVERLV